MSSGGHLCLQKEFISAGRHVKKVKTLIKGRHRLRIDFIGRRGVIGVNCAHGSGLVASVCRNQQVESQENFLSFFFPDYRRRDASLCTHFLSAVG